MTVSVESSGISNQGTSWRKFTNGNVELTFADGATTIINPSVLGLTLDEAILSFEGQLQSLTPSVQITDQEYLDLVQDILGELPVHDPSVELTPGAGLAIGLALLPMFMVLSKKGLQDLTSLLGFFPIPVLNSLNQWVIGFQYVIPDEEVPFYQSFPMSVPQAIQLLLQQVSSVFMPLIQNLIKVPLTQAQFDSLLGSAVAMGPTRFATSGMPGRVNAGDFPSAAEIRECYNSTNGDYDPAKGFAANSQSMGIQQTTDQDGATTIADPNLIGLVEGPAVGSEQLHQPATGVTDAINAAAKTSSVMSDRNMAAALYGMAHTESALGNLPTNPNSTAGGPFHYLKGTWVEDVTKYGDAVPGLAQYSAALRANPNSTALQSQVAKLRFDPALSAQLTVQTIERKYMPNIQNHGLPVNLGSIYAAHYIPGRVSQTYNSGFKSSQMNTGWTYANRYYR